MRYPLKFLRRVGLVSTLLIGGVLGGLMAPLPSDAHPPTLTIKVDSGNVETIPLVFTTPATAPNPPTCTTSTATPDLSETGQGFNYCYGIDTSRTYGVSPFQFKIQNAQGAVNCGVAGGNPPNPPCPVARLLVADKTTKDLFVLTGVQIIAVGSWPSTPKHTVLITMKNTFNVKPNAVTTAVAGTAYVFALKTG